MTLALDGHESEVCFYYSSKLSTKERPQDRIWKLTREKVDKDRGPEGEDEWESERKQCGEMKMDREEKRKEKTTRNW